MTAGAGILHDELPIERFYRWGGPIHGIQLWVNLPAELKFSHPATKPSQATRCEVRHAGSLWQSSRGQRGAQLAHA